MQMIQQHLLVLLFLDKEPPLLEKQLRPPTSQTGHEILHHAFEESIRTAEVAKQISKAKNSRKSLYPKILQIDWRRKYSRL